MIWSWNMLNGPVHKDGFVFVFDWKKVYSV